MHAAHPGGHALQQIHEVRALRRLVIQREQRVAETHHAGLVGRQEVAFPQPGAFPSLEIADGRRRAHGVPAEVHRCQPGAARFGAAPTIAQVLEPRLPSETLDDDRLAATVHGQLYADVAVAPAGDRPRRRRSQPRRQLRQPGEQSRRAILRRHFAHVPTCRYGNRKLGIRPVS
jgi:hypothetical protein